MGLLISLTTIRLSGPVRKPVHTAPQYDTETSPRSPLFHGDAAGLEGLQKRIKAIDVPI
jgi:hypothetical protein